MGIGPGEDPVHRQGRDVRLVACPALRREHATERGADRQTAASPLERRLNVLPGLAGRSRDRSGILGRPRAVALAMRIGPAEDLRDAQRREVACVAPPALPVEHPGQRRSTGEAPDALAHGQVDGHPVLAGSLGDEAVVARRPAAGAPVEGISPRQDLLVAQRRKTGLVPDPATLGEQLGQGRTARETADSLTQAGFDSLPALPGRLRDRTGFVVGPSARARVMGISPGEDPFQVPGREIHPVAHPAAPPAVVAARNRRPGRECLARAPR